MTTLEATTRLEATITAVARRCLRDSHKRGPRPAQEGPLPFSGLDSLAAIELAAALEEALRCELPADLLVDCPDARVLAARLARRGLGVAPAADPFEQMVADAVLPDDIQPRPARLVCRRYLPSRPRASTPICRRFRDISRLRRRVHGSRCAGCGRVQHRVRGSWCAGRGGRGGASAGLRQARTILLTGATGFLGSALLDELLRTSRATIVCLVRPTSAPIRPRTEPRIEPRTEARIGMGSRSQTWTREKIKSALASAARVRVRVVTGDLSQPSLGLSASQYDALTREVDAVCHAAAAVNWIYSYASLRAANVLGTLELLRLACRGGAAFHFISSLSTCYSTRGPRIAGEDFDPLPVLRGIHLGYAQTKVVGEALVREAGRRGLPVRIYRPPLIAGHSVTGDFNRDDLLSTLIRGCVHMGLAPDLDWKLDCEPVDVVARAIVQLSGESSSQTVFHLAHARPRHWRECLLWMRMYGYDVRLVSYHAWLRRVERETAPGVAGSEVHPLRPLRSFLLDRIADAHGLTLPELYEERRRTQATRSATATTGPDLDAALLDTYFAAFRAAGHLPDPPDPPDPPNPPASNARACRPPRSDVFDNIFDIEFLSSVIAAPVRHVDVRSTGSDHSIVSELTAWRSSVPAGLFHARLTLDDASSRDVVIKIKARDTEVMAVGAALADLVDPGVGRAYRRHIDRLGFTASHAREIALYRQTDPRLTRHLPRVLGTVADDARDAWIVVLEDVRRDAVLIDAVDRPEDWRQPEIAAAIDGLAALHAVWLDQDDELKRQPWIGHVPDARAVAEMSDLWTALADHAAPRFSAWADVDIAQIHHHLAATAGHWWQPLEAGPRTLIHHDFNPRNICLRVTANVRTEISCERSDGGRGASELHGGKSRGGACVRGERLRLCVYDWELATLGAPQRDLAELLCFVLTEDTAADAAEWIEHHRVALERASGRTIDVEPWMRGFSAALGDLLIDRLAMYALVHRVRHQSFLARVVRTWRRLYQQFPLDGAS
jgi:thioester reductase-like protein